MPPFLLAWLATAPIFAVLDALWLSQTTTRLYRPLLGALLAPRVEVAPAIVFYLLYITGIVTLAVMPALERGGLAKAFFLGAALGLVAYGTYDLTNQATLKGWDLRITLADMGWGAFASAVTAAGAFAVTSRLLGR